MFYEPLTKSLNVLWGGGGGVRGGGVVLSSDCSLKKFFQAIDVCLRLRKATKVGSTATVSGTVY